MSHYDYFDPLAQDSNSSDIQFDQDDSQDRKHKGNANKKRQKGNTKNTYINKISSLIKITTQDNENEKYSKKQLNHKTKSQLINPVQLGEKEEKLAKNRESARNSRKRKKIYLELLEGKVTKLSEILEIFKKVNESTSELAINLENKMQQKHEQDETKMILFNNLQNSIQSNVSEANIDTIIESLNKKFGSSQIERHNLIDHYARQIYENCLSPYITYIVGVEKTEQDIFSNSDQYNENQLLKNLKLTDKQKQLIIKKSKKLARYQNELMNTLASLQEVKNQAQGELHAYSQTIESLRKELRPSQVARFLLSIEKKDMNHSFRDQFERYFGSEMEEDDSLDLYQFMAEHNICNNLAIDAQNTYQIYKASNDFLSGKLEQEFLNNNPQQN